MCVQIWHAGPSKTNPIAFSLTYGGGVAHVQDASGAAG